MTFFYNLLVFIVVLFFLVNYIHHFYFIKQQLFVLPLPFYINKKHLSKVYIINKNEEIKDVNNDEKDAILKKQLHKYLKTLNYLAIIEIDTNFNKNRDKTSKILDLKIQIQKNILEIMFKMNEYKL